MNKTFKPTYIYVKTCNHCDLKYVGKSCLKTRKEVCKYTGSGLHWERHLKLHGKDYRTDIINFFDEDEKYFCEYFCIQFSKENDIIKSKKWANCILENGLDGGSCKGRLMGEKNPMYGKKFSTEHKTNISKAKKR